MRTFFISGAGFLHHRCRYDARRYGDNRVAQQHDQCGEETSGTRHRGNVTIADGGERHDRPIYTIQDVIEPRRVIRSFDHIHQRTERDGQNQDKEEENEDFATTLLE